MVMWVDKKLVTPRKGVTVRKACGLPNLGQTIKLPVSNGWTTDQIIPTQRP